MDLSAANVSDFLRAMGNKPNGEIVLCIESLKSNNTSSTNKQAVLKEIDGKVGIGEGGAIGRLLIPKIDAGFDYKNDWKDCCESLSAEWVASKAMLIIRWNANQSQEGYTRLHSAAAQQDVAWVENLLTSDEWVETLCGKFSPLHIARDIGNKEVIKMLQDYKTEHAKKTKAVIPPPPYAETEKPKTTSDRKVEIHKSKLSAAMQSHAIGCAMQALNEFGNAEGFGIAEYIRDEFDGTYSDGSWHCIVSFEGHRFRSCVNYCHNCYISFKIGEFKFLLFKTPKC